MNDRAKVETLPPTSTIALSSLVVDERFQSRATMDPDAIAEYVEAIRTKKCWPFPPIKVVSQFVVDGFHRVEAAKQVIADTAAPAVLRKSLQSISCERVPVETVSDDVPAVALRHALAANQTHGLKRTSEDKRRSVELAIRQWPDESNRAIAKLTGTSHTFVATVRGYPEVATLPPSESLCLAIQALSVGQGLECFHYDDQGELIGNTVIAYLNPDDPFHCFQVADWNGRQIAFSQWGSINRVLWALRQLRSELEAMEFELTENARPLMEMAYKRWRATSPNKSREAGT
ncbi:hypothetical protein FF011L_05660 [Roseimaritima multifibrata]|uniref:ParB-like nuclease domain protein n=1 Tax=Roseimaritima multifibrata TaxID=1930274 RepID=A0A517MAF7_9BACT|nr:ParB/RepB/Spo0J family partition protein [Roseimaritima multifibrata]QDS91831.1 hypothetical protein FF011L_05660 [Roseimaritima multifibrata]